MEEYIDWFIDNDFLKTNFKDFSVYEFLFNRRKYEKDVKNVFDFFINKYVFQAHKDGFLPDSLLLEIIGIFDIISYMNRHFTREVNKDDSLMSESAPFLLAKIICTQSAIRSSL